MAREFYRWNTNCFPTFATSSCSSIEPLTNESNSPETGKSQNEF